MTSMVAKSSGPFPLVLENHCRVTEACHTSEHSMPEPFGITRFYTDGWGAYERHIDVAILCRTHRDKELTQHTRCVR